MTDPVSKAINVALRQMKSVSLKETYENAYKNMKKAAVSGKVLKDLQEDVLHSENEYNQDFTVKLTFPMIGKPYLRDYVLDSLSDLDREDIVALGPLNDNSKWLLTLGSKEAVARALALQPKPKGHQARVFSLRSDIVQMCIHWLPVYVPMADVLVNVSKYGTVHSAKWDYSKIQGFEHVKSTVSNIIIEMSEGVEVPSTDELFYDGENLKFLLTIPGRGPVCFRCNKVCHTRQNCYESFCRHCQKYGDHTSEDCSEENSYAGKARGSATAAKTGEVVHDFFDDSDRARPALDEAESQNQKEVQKLCRVLLLVGRKMRGMMMAMMVGKKIRMRLIVI